MEVRGPQAGGHGWASWPVTLVLVFAGYAVLGLIGKQFALAPSHVSAIWPAAGFGVAMALLRGWPAVAGVGLGAFLVSLHVTGSPASGLDVGLASVGAGAAAALEAALCRSIILRWTGTEVPLATGRDTAVLIGAALVASIVGAVIGTASAIPEAMHEAVSPSLDAFTWAVGHFAGVILVAPLMLALGRRPWRGWGARQGIELALVLLVSAALGYLGFLENPGPSRGLAQVTLVYLAIPIVLWGALRLRQVGALAAALVLAITAIVATAAGEGPLAEGVAAGRLLSVQGFVVVVVVTGLLVSAVLEQREANRRALERTRAGLAREVEARTSALSDSNARLTRENAERRSAEAAVQAHARQLQGLARTTIEVNRVLELPVVMRKLVISSLGLLGARGGTAGMVSGDRLRFLEYFHRDGSYPIDVAFRLGDGVPGWVWLTREPYVSHDAAHDPHVLQELQREFGFSNLADVPILDREGRLVGCIELHDRPGGFGPAEVELMQALASSASNAIENARLLEAERALAREQRAASASKDEFLATLGHELRNPLAAMSTAVQLLQTRALDGVAARARSVLERQLGHITRLVNDLLDVSRLQHGKVRLQKKPLDLAELARVVVQDHRAEAERRGIALEARAPGRPTWVQGDRTRLVQVVENLVGNALKFTPPGGRIAVEVEDGGPEATITVDDTGVGIDPLLLPRLFQPFEQAERGLGRESGGLGLGLALTKGLVELHGGSVEGRSDGVGRGSRFLVRLPVAPPPGAPLGEPGVEGHPAVAAQRILVVEDNADFADGLKALLALRGHEVAVARDGPEGLAAARRFRPDVVLCDIGLPGDLDGYQVARALRAEPQFDRVRLVALTGYGKPEDRRRALAAGFDAHLSKPTPVETIEGALTPAPSEPPA